jgi:Tfp pilus assembly protein PilX
MFRKNKKGIILILIFIIMATLSSVTLAYLYMISIRTRSSSRELASAQAFWLAEAGLSRARWELTDGGQAAGWGQADVPLGAGTYTVGTLDNRNNTCTITSEGYIPNDVDPVSRRMVIEKNIPVTIEGNLSVALGKGEYLTFW